MLASDHHFPYNPLTSVSYSLATLMSQAIIKEIQASQIKDRPQLQAGYVVRVHQKIREGEKDRIQVFEGVVIKIGSGTGSDKSFRVRKIVEGVGVEKIFPIHSPAISQIEVIRKGKVRRAKLYYMRALSGRKARLSEKASARREREGAGALRKKTEKQAAQAAA